MATIIIQENDSAVLEILTQALAEEGYNAVPLADPSPPKLLAAIKKYHPHLVMIDYRSTGERGIELLKTVRNSKPKIPVLALSSNNNIERSALKAGFQGYIKKPFDLNDLYQTLDRFFAG